MELQVLVIVLLTHVDTLITGRRRTEIMQWISDVPFKAHHTFHREKRNKDTGYWLMENEKYMTWRTARSSIIWLRGDGKFQKIPVLLISKLICI